MSKRQKQAKQRAEASLNAQSGDVNYAEAASELARAVAQLTCYSSGQEKAINSTKF